MRDTYDEGFADGIRAELKLKNARIAALEADKARLVDSFKECVEELEASGYCHDHPSLIKYRAAIDAARGEGE